MAGGEPELPCAIRVRTWWATGGDGSWTPVVEAVDALALTPKERSESNGVPNSGHKETK